MLNLNRFTSGNGSFIASFLLFWIIFLIFEHQYHKYRLARELEEGIIMVNYVINCTQLYLFITASSESEVAGVDCSPAFESGVSYSKGEGREVSKKNIGSPEKCQQFCHGEFAKWCTVWVYHNDRKNCYIKEAHGGKKDEGPQRTSGLRIDGCFVGN